MNFGNSFLVVQTKVIAFDVEHSNNHLNHQLAGRGAPDLERLYTVAQFEWLAALTLQ